MQSPQATLSYPKSKLLIMALLCVNAVIYAVVDTLTSALDALAWLMLLILYELETHRCGFALSAKRLEWMRNGLIVLIAGVFFSYLNTSEWLDVVNASLWFVLIALMELEVRHPAIIMQHANLFWLLTLLIFSGLLGMTGLWFWQHAWLDAYDALLWLVAFGSIEADIFQLLKRRQPLS